MWVYITSRKMTPHQNCSISAELDNNSDDSEAPRMGSSATALQIQNVAVILANQRL